jgi:ribosomal protein S18 acetylase RimI-like enzyme
MRAPTLRRAVAGDVGELARMDRCADLEGGGVVVDGAGVATVLAFITDADKSAWVLEDPTDRRIVGTILFRFRPPPSEGDLSPDAWLFRELPAELFRPPSLFCVVFTLWVEPDCRRRGYGTVLKDHMAEEARSKGASMIYTHTTVANTPALELNRKLGYQAVRRGPIWDQVVRVSLVKRL